MLLRKLRFIHLARYLFLVFAPTACCERDCRTGANVLKGDFFADIRDVIGGRSNAYEKVLREAKDTSLHEMQERIETLGANTVVDIGLIIRPLGSLGVCSWWRLAEQRYSFSAAFPAVLASPARATSRGRPFLWGLLRHLSCRTPSSTA